MSRRIVRPLVATAVAVTALATPTVISRPEPASAYTTIYYDGAGPSVPRIGLIGDSTLAATRWYGILGSLTRYNFVLDAESCRRTTHTSCRGREGYAPENTLTVMRRLEGQWGRVLVLMTGYDDPGYDFGDAIDAVMREAIRQGIPRVMWLTFRTADVSYVGPTYHSDLHTFRDNNKLLLQKALKYGGRLQIADWATRSADRRDWVLSDGVHLSTAGTEAVTKFIVNKVGQVLAGRTITPPRPNIPPCRTGVALRVGDHLRDVRCLERHLRSLGFNLNVNNHFGAETVAAVNLLNWARSWGRDGVADRRVLRAAGVWRAHRERPWCAVGRTLEFGDRGPGVRCLRRALAARGYLLAAGGPFADALPDAVRHFKRTHGLAGARRVGKETLQLLGIRRPMCRVSAPLAIGDKGRQVWCLRRFLAGRGIQIPVEGRYTARVARAVRQLEARRGLRVDGIADRTFLRAVGAWRIRR
jgi:peptidoglycan hydrolase-like protein with peptidoglycan-binding domain